MRASLYCLRHFFQNIVHRYSSGSRNHLISSRSYAVLSDSREQSNNKVQGSKNVTENLFVYSFLVENVAYNKTILKLQDYVSQVSEKPPIINDSELETTSWRDISLEELCSHFESASCEMGYKRKMSIANERFVNICSAISARCNEMSDEQIALVLKSLILWKFSDSNKSNEFRTLSKSLDKVCILRINSWSISEKFYFVNLWYNLGLIRKSNFAYLILKKFINKPSRLKPQELVQLLYYLNSIRSLTKRLGMYEVEYALEICIEKLSLEEVAIAAMGFFKTENSFHSEKLLNHIIDRILNEAKSAHEIVLTALLKALRRSLLISVWPRVPQLMDVICNEVDRISLTCAAHAALITAKPQLIHELLLTKVSQKLVDHIKEARLKDMEKIVFCLAILNFDVKTRPMILETVTDELIKPEREEELLQYPKSFVALVHYLCMKGMYNDRLVEKVLDFNFITHTYGESKFKFGRELLYIDTIMELEYPSYNGVRLSTDIRNYLSMRYSSYLPDPNRNVSKHGEWHLEIIQTAETLFGKDFIVNKYLLPNHPRADIVIGLDKSGNAIPLPPSIKETQDFTGPIYAPGDNFYAIVVGTKNMFLYNSVIPNGETASKLKQLKILGFKPILVTSTEWPKSNIEKLKHLKELVTS